MKSRGRIFAVMFFLTSSLLFSIPTKAQTTHAFYVPPNGNLRELTGNTGSWVPTNVFSGQVYSPQNTTVASFAGGGKMYVCYFNPGNNLQPPESVWVLSSPDNKNWTHTAVSTMDVDINSGLTGFVDSSGNPRIFYVGAPVGGVEYLLETSWNGSSWQTVQLYGGVEPGTALTGYLFNGNPSAYYIAVDGHVHEEFQVGSTWYNTDMRVASGGQSLSQEVRLSATNSTVTAQFTLLRTTFTSTKPGGMDRRGTRTMSLP
jgi:hypothetical protein